MVSDPVDSSARSWAGFRRGRQRAAVLRALLLGAGVAVVLFCAWYAWDRIIIGSVIERGLELVGEVLDPKREPLPNPPTPTGGRRDSDDPVPASAEVASPNLQSRLALWDDELTRWGVDPDAVAERLIRAYSLADLRARALLTHLTGCDFGADREEWRQWLKGRSRSRDTSIAMTGGRRPVRLQHRWSAPVGLTAWYSTLFAIDGTIFIASLGSAIGDPTDSADGVVRVDGKTGDASVIFTPADPGNRDVVGIASGGPLRLFAASRNGFVYCIRHDGELIWKAPLAGPAVTPPLGLDLNSDTHSDVVVLNQAGKLVALNGVTGKTIWVATVAKPPPAARSSGDDPIVRPSVALIGDRARPALLATTTEGHVARIDARSGRIDWHGSLSSGTRGCPIGLNPRRYSGNGGVTISLTGAVWTLSADAERLICRTDWVLPITPAAHVFSSPRGLVRRYARGTGPLIIACIGSASRPSGNSVCAFGDEGLVWRFPPGGNIWATPAVADVNNDKASDLLVASVVPGDAGELRGLLTVISDNGQFLARAPLPHAAETSPLVSDVDGDDKLEILVADQSGLLHCFATQSPGAVEWGSLGGDSHNTMNSDAAFEFGQTPFGYQAAWRP